ncbi:hypothetical protein ACJJTC_009509 [Scirpophaga incertulas]
MFAANSKQNEKFLRDNLIDCRKICKGVLGTMVLMIMVWQPIRFTLLWTRRLTSLPELSFLNNYDLRTRIIEVFALQLFKCIWMAIGHVGLDILIITYYLQAAYQLRLIKFNLQHLFDLDIKTRRGRLSGRFQYLDESNVDIEERFIYYICRYKKVVWLVKNVGDIFGFAIANNICWLTFAMCFSIYDASLAGFNNYLMVYWATILSVHIGETFFYCYFGSLIQNEVLTSKYLSNFGYLIAVLKPIEYD